MPKQPSKSSPRETTSEPASAPREVKRRAPGGGRKPLMDAREKRSVNMDASEWARLDALAKRSGIRTSELIRRAVAAHLDAEQDSGGPS